VGLETSGRQMKLMGIFDSNHHTTTFFILKQGCYEKKFDSETLILLPAVVLVVCRETTTFIAF